MSKKSKLYGRYFLDGRVIPNEVSPYFEEQILKKFFLDECDITSFTVKLGIINNVYTRSTQLNDIAEAVNYTPVTIEFGLSDWNPVSDKAVCMHIETKDLEFVVTPGLTTQFNVMYIVDQDNNLLTCSARESSLIEQPSTFILRYGIGGL